MRELLKRAVTDQHGDISHARIIALMVGASATIFMWKLVVTGALTETYFWYYLAYGVIHMNVSKFLDVVNNWVGGKNGQGRQDDAGSDGN